MLTVEVRSSPQGSDARRACGTSHKDRDDRRGSQPAKVARTPDRPGNTASAVASKCARRICTRTFGSAFRLSSQAGGFSPPKLDATTRYAPPWRR